MTPQSRLFPALLAVCVLGLCVTFLSVFPPRTAHAAPDDALVGKTVVVKLGTSSRADYVVDFFEGKVAETSATGLTIASTKVTTVRNGSTKGTDWKAKILFPWSSVLYVEIKD